MATMMFHDDFNFSMDSELMKNNLICDVLLSSSDINSVLRESSIDSYDQSGRSPGMESLEFCVPNDEAEMAMAESVQAGATPGGYNEMDQGDSPQYAGSGPMAAPPTSFPSVDVGYLRRRCKAEGGPGGKTPIQGRRRAESDPVIPLRSSARNDTRKRRVDDQGRRSAMMELSEEERLEKNRQSARDCRLRKKRYIENLERRISEYEKREIVLTSTIARLEEQLAHALNAVKLPVS